MNQLIYIDFHSLERNIDIKLTLFGDGEFALEAILEKVDSLKLSLAILAARLGLFLEFWRQL